MLTTIDDVSLDQVEAIRDATAATRNELHRRYRDARDRGDTVEAHRWITLAADVSVQIIRLDMALRAGNQALQ